MTRLHLNDYDGADVERPGRNGGGCRAGLHPILWYFALYLGSLLLVKGLAAAVHDTLHGFL